ncbi:MAG: hypothetical protein M1817_005042 [Caeruleum heppii]|nr:MAG: hypothetical protein M1817_005042 [Caeruleum heppii]
MNIYACGWNPHGQLKREAPCTGWGFEDEHPSPWNETVCDRLMIHPEKIAGAERIQVMWASNEGTIVNVDGSLHYWGFFDRRLPTVDLTEDPWVHHGGPIKSDLLISDLIFTLPELMLFAGGHVRILRYRESTFYLEDPIAERIAKTPGLRQVNKISLMTQSGNGYPQCLIIVPEAKETASPSNLALTFSGYGPKWRRAADQVLDWLFDKAQPQSIATFLAPVRQIVARGSIVYALMSDGRVYASKGTDPIPINLPPVPMTRMFAQGCIGASISQAQDLYLWGDMRSPHYLDKNITDLPPIFQTKDTGIQTKKVRILGGAKIADVAVGYQHVVALTVDGRLFAAGRGALGELGIGLRVYALEDEFAVDWVELAINLPPDKRATGVFCGPENTFVLVESVTEPAES